MKAFQEEQVYHHFSHHHPMVHAKLSSTGNIVCSGCKLNIPPATKGYYQCKTCPYFLHQVCYNMPRKTRHPGHPNHFLTLHIMPSSSKDTFKCEACGHHANGFYYYCSECSFCYHILCSALPLSVAITSHLHALKLEFSPPYDLQCDICKELASYNEWLYRCQICEYDAHLACAISHQRTQSFQHSTAPLPEPLTRQIMYSSASLMETKQREDYVNEGIELMQLVSQGVTRNIRENRTQDNFLKAVVGWDERLHSPKKMLTSRNGKVEYSGLSPKPQIVVTSPNLKVQAQEADQSSLLSVDLSTAPSYQFSDGCFSIDLARSHSSLDHSILARKEPKLSDASTLQKVKETINDKNNIMLERITSNFEPAKPQTVYAKKGSFDFHNPDSRINEAFLTRDSTHSREQRNRKISSVSEIEDPSSKPKNILMIPSID
ncbi:Zinc finger, PHD-type [Corchorus olitorius]|uniref:Zinc finger, PHD-type n=1 Tax=Corchorus olitorius TaxID=93759 RepID=A0A1R3HF21_9ROSI|nr:Zinc finger, PHD-type [Corchorus olitorius]